MYIRAVLFFFQKFNFYLRKKIIIESMANENYNIFPTFW